MPFTTPQKKRPSGGAAPAGGTGAVGGAATTAPSAAPGFVDFGRILDANQAGAKSMAGRLTGKVEQAGQQASSAMETARSDFGNKVQAGTVKYQDPDASYTRTPGGSASADLYRTAGALQTQAKQGYAGPKSWADAGHNAGDMATKAAQAQDDAKRLTSMGGRGAMLREGATSNYSTGMSTMDSALAGAAMGGRGAELAHLYGSLSQKLIDYQKQGGEAVTAATTTSNEAAKKYGEQAERYQVLGDQSKAEEERAKAYQEEYYRRYPKLRPGNPAPKPIMVDGRPVDPRLLTPGLYG